MVLFSSKKIPSFLAEPVKVKTSYLVNKNLKSFRVQVLKSCGYLHGFLLYIKLYVKEQKIITADLDS